MLVAGFASASRDGLPNQAPHFVTDEVVAATFTQRVQAKSLTGC